MGGLTVELFRTSEIVRLFLNSGSGFGTMFTILREVLCRNLGVA